MKLTWIEIKNIKEYIDAVINCEAEDIPRELFEGEWVQSAVSINDIQVDESMIIRHDNDAVHIQRRDSFIKSINSGAPILPLIVLNCDRGQQYLIDGYARYRALKSLNIDQVQVLKQIKL
jgi:hypothetical protein